MALAQEQQQRVSDDDIAIAIAAGMETDARTDADAGQCDWKRLAENSFYRNAWAAAMLDNFHGSRTADAAYQGNAWHAQCAAHHDSGAGSAFDDWVEF
ncbi:MAG: hypothetical protein AAFN18_11825 [Cyanobacteria bacterium J06554_6]